MISIHALREESDWQPDSTLCLAFLISIHALREESDHDGRRAVKQVKISIHALREESDADDE